MSDKKEKHPFKLLESSPERIAEHDQVMEKIRAAQKEYELAEAMAEDYETARADQEKAENVERDTRWEAHFAEGFRRSARAGREDRKQAEERMAGLGLPSIPEPIVTRAADQFAEVLAPHHQEAGAIEGTWAKQIWWRWHKGGRPEFAIDAFRQAVKNKHPDWSEDEQEAKAKSLAVQANGDRRIKEEKSKPKKGIPRNQAR